MVWTSGNLVTAARLNKPEFASGLLKIIDGQWLVKNPEDTIDMSVINSSFCTESYMNHGTTYNDNFLTSYTNGTGLSIVNHRITFSTPDKNLWVFSNSVYSLSIGELILKFKLGTVSHIQNGGNLFLGFTHSISPSSLLSAALLYGIFLFKDAYDNTFIFWVRNASGNSQTSVTISSNDEIMIIVTNTYAKLYRNNVLITTVTSYLPTTSNLYVVFGTAQKASTYSRTLEVDYLELTRYL